MSNYEKQEIAYAKEIMAKALKPVEAWEKKIRNNNEIFKKAGKAEKRVTSSSSRRSLGFNELPCVVLGGLVQEPSMGAVHQETNVTTLRKRIEELMDKAKAATAGPWRSTWDDPVPTDLHYNDDEIIVEAPEKPHDPEDPFGKSVVGLFYYDGKHIGCTRENAAHIASFNPKVALALLQVVESITVDRVSLRATTNKALDRLAEVLEAER